MREPGPRALFIGCGGGLSVRQFAEVYPGISIDVVDVSEAVVRLARDWFALDTIPHVSVHIAEGSDFMANAPPSRWDVIVVDAYGAGLARTLVSRHFFRQARRALSPGGQMAFNVIGTLEGESDVQTVERCARAELSNVRLVPVLDPGERCDPGARRNVVVLGGAE